MNEILFKKAVELLPFIKDSDECCPYEYQHVGYLIVPINDKRVDIYMYDNSGSFASSLFDKTEFENDDDQTRILELIEDDIAKATEELVKMNPDYDHVRFIESHEDDLLNMNNPWYKDIIDQYGLDYQVSIVE